MIQVKILGAAANWSKSFKAPGIKKFTSCYFKTDSYFQIDAGNKWQKQKLDYLLITHLHKDHIKEINSYPKDIKFLIPDKSFTKVIPLANKSFILKRGQKNKIKKTIIEPFAVYHSQTTLTVGYKITYQRHSFIWLPDFFSPLCYRYFKNCDVWFIDASSFKKDIKSKGRKRGHRAILNFLRECRKRKLCPITKKVYLIHLGLSMFPIKNKIKYLQNKFPLYTIKATKEGEIIKV